MTDKIETIPIVPPSDPVPPGSYLTDAQRKVAGAFTIPGPGDLMINFAVQMEGFKAALDDVTQSMVKLLAIDWAADRRRASRGWRRHVRRQKAQDRRLRR